MSDPTAHRYFPALDGFRGVAIILVMMSHFIIAGDLVGHDTPFSRLMHGGFVGVDMFFVLSGFLITGILLDAPHRRFFRVFYLRRAVRIFPLYYVVLIGVFLTCPSGPDSPLWYWFFASNIGATLKGNWLQSPEGVQLSHFWSLAVEEQFYMVWPLLVRYLNRRHLEWVCFACLFIGPAAHYWLYKSGNDTGSYLFTATRLNTLGAGAWLAILYREPERWTRWMRVTPWVLLISGIYCLTAVMFPTTVVQMRYAPFLWASVLTLAMRPTSPVQGWLSNRILVIFGKLSYGLYILHYLFDPWLKRVVFGEWIVGLTGGRSVLSLLIFIVVAFTMTFAAAWISWRVLEKPMLSLKRHFRY